ncbi:MAG: hypothetical protein ACYST0_12630 [Planctomycetota bacterium]|jgi:H+/Cl- antiporter ClcA
MLTALVAALLFAIPSIARGADPGFSCCWNCTAGILIWFLGVLPAFMLSRQGPHFTGGHGFAAAFIGVGGGSAVGVILQMLYPGMDEVALRESIGELTKELMNEIQRQGQPAPMPQAELQEMLGTCFLAAPIPLALVGSVVAGFVGMLTLNLISRRRPPQYPPPTPQEHPPQTPPPQEPPPVSPWSDPQA